MIEIKVDKGVPIDGSLRNSKYPWKQMEVGDSFFMADKKYDDLRSAASYQGSRNRQKYEVHTVVENGVKGVRVWRTA